jgi:hypothetical protein
MIKITLPKDNPSYTLRVPIDGADFVLRFEWMERAGWFVGMDDALGVTIFSPKRIVADWDLLQDVTDNRRPRGVLMGIDTTKYGLDPIYEDLGQRVVLVYFEEGELE